MKLKVLGVLCAMFVAFGFVSQSFAVTAVVDVDRVMFQYTKAKTVAEQFRVKDEQLRKEIIDAQAKIKAAKTPVEKKSLEETYEKQLKTKAENLKIEELKKLKEIDTEVMNVINKINANGKYDLILKKSATVYCPNDITNEVLRMLNSK